MLVLDFYEIPMKETSKIHKTADVSPEAKIGSDCLIWHQAQIRERAVVGKNCVIGKGVYIDYEVIIGDNVRIQNYVSVFHGVTIEKGVFLGPYVTFTNDRFPRAIKPDGSPRGRNDWRLEKTLVKEGASIGAGAIILPGVTVGRWSLVGSGSVVTKDIPDFALVVGVPASIVGYVCKCAKKMVEGGRCDVCSWQWSKIVSKG